MLSEAEGCGSWAVGGAVDARGDVWACVVIVCPLAGCAGCCPGGRCCWPMGKGGWMGESSEEGMELFGEIFSDPNSCEKRLPMLNISKSWGRSFSPTVNEPRGDVYGEWNK